MEPEADVAMTRLAIAAVALVTGLSVACGPTGPSSVSESQVPPATGGWAPDTAAVSAGIVAELHALGVEAAVADRFGGAPFSVGMQRVALPSVAGNNIYLFVYRTAALAADEASRIRPDGNVVPVEGPMRVIVDYIGTQHFYYRDRVIGRHSGCDATVKGAMETLFGPPVVVTSSTCTSIFTSMSGDVPTGVMDEAAIEAKGPAVSVASRSDLGK
jgi:hypothetical protein